MGRQCEAGEPRTKGVSTSSIVSDLAGRRVAVVTVTHDLTAVVQSPRSRTSECPLCPQKRSSSKTVAMSAKCHIQTHAAQQTTNLRLTPFPCKRLRDRLPVQRELRFTLPAARREVPHRDDHHKASLVGNVLRSRKPSCFSQSVSLFVDRREGAALVCDLHHRQILVDVLNVKANLASASSWSQP